MTNGCTVGVERVPQRLRRRYANREARDEQRVRVEIYPSFGRHVMAVKRSPGAVIAARGLTSACKEATSAREQ